MFDYHYFIYLLIIMIMIILQNVRLPSFYLFIKHREHVFLISLSWIPLLYCVLHSAENIRFPSFNLFIIRHDYHYFTECSIPIILFIYH